MHSLVSYIFQSSYLICTKLLFCIVPGYPKNKHIVQKGHLILRKSIQLKKYSHTDLSIDTTYYRVNHTVHTHTQYHACSPNEGQVEHLKRFIYVTRPLLAKR